MALLNALKVTKRFGGLTAVGRLDFDIQPQMIASLIGPNGAGKTTFFNCLTGFYVPEEGSIEFDGIPIAGLPSDRITALGIARTYQNIRLFNNMTVIENVLVGQHCRLRASMIGAVLRGISTRKEEEQALHRGLELLEYVGLMGKADFLASNLPYGEQRRLEIARALASDPKLLLLDEPTAGMNPNETDRLQSFIHRLRDELGLTILLIEHDMRMVMGVSDRVTVLDYGVKIAEGKPAEIQRNPQVIEAYLGRGAANELPELGTEEIQPSG